MAQLGVVSGSGVGAGAGAGAGLGAAAFFRGVLFFAAFLAAFFGAAFFAFLADFFAVFFADFFADFLADLFTDFLADFFEAFLADFFFAITDFLAFLAFLLFLLFFPLAIVILLLPPIDVVESTVCRASSSRSWPGQSIRHRPRASRRPIEKLNRMHHRN